MSEERTVDAESRTEGGSGRARRASTAAAERARETSKVAQQWWGRARQRIAEQTSAGVEFGRLKRDQLKHQREIARRERAAAHTQLEAVSDRLAAGRSADRKS